MVEAVVEAAQYGVRVGGGAAQRTQPNTRPLGRPIVGRKGPYIWLQRDEGLGLGFQQTAAFKPGKNRMHFDTTSPDPAAEQQRVEKLGGCRLEKYASGGFLVMADPRVTSSASSLRVPTNSTTRGKRTTSTKGK